MFSLEGGVAVLRIHWVLLGFLGLIRVACISRSRMPREL